MRPDAPIFAQARESVLELSKVLAAGAPGTQLTTMGDVILQGTVDLIGAREGLAWIPASNLSRPPVATYPLKITSRRVQVARTAARETTAGQPTTKPHIAVAATGSAPGLQSVFVLMRRPNEPFSLADRRLLSRLSPLLAAIINATLAVAEQRRLVPTADPSRATLDLLAALAHDMRTPLASIKGYATGILAQSPPWAEEKVREALEIIDHETTTLTTLISELLEAAAIDSGRLTLQLEPVLLNRVLQRLVAEFARQSVRHQFQVVFPETWPVIVADPQRLEQVFRNIIDNALKYSPRGGPITVQGSMAPGEVVISIEDRGIGIAPEDLNRLFEKFFRARRAVSVAGSGLGLPIAHAIVEEHGGRIWADSTLGKGTTLHVALPRGRKKGRSTR